MKKHATTMIPTICSPRRTEPPVEPPVLHPFGIDPGARKHCFNRSIAEESPHENFMPCDILDDLQTIRHVRSITAVNATELRVFQNKETITSIRKLRDTTSLALLRLQETENTPGAASTPPESPVSWLSHEAKSAGESDNGNHRKLRPRIQASSQGVVHGTGVVSKQWFKKNDFIALYHGPLIYRRKSRQSGRQKKYNVFRLEQGKGSPVPRFLEKDTFAAWSNVFLKHSGTPGIEIGRDAVGPIRYLNHSKNANVKIITPRVAGRLAFNECDQLLLRVIALKDISPGEELLFDYDPGLPESEIDFTLSTVEKPGQSKVKAIRTVVRNIIKKQ
ncbi:SET domain-containing protein [Endozoicomonas sp. YOMI1]|uniref:SET domain-containing protein n=1 Tax=Endozoicomonas sp. YOMI1 TaxID=2828739 RepID=UPI0021478A48|nr:SET domain-containing protein [Endozoicomonas sp. YOMI1]